MIKANAFAEFAVVSSQMDFSVILDQNGAEPGRHVAQSACSAFRAMPTSTSFQIAS